MSRTNDRRASLKVEDWTLEIEDLERCLFFSKTIKTPIKIGCMTIIDVETFVKYSLNVVKHNNGIKVYKPYLSQLQQLKKHLENEQET